MDAHLLCGRTGLGLARLCLAGAIALCLWAPPAAAQKVEGSDITVLKDQVKRDDAALKSAVTEAREKKPDDPAVKKAEDELDAAERKLLEKQEGSAGAKQAQKDVDAARKAADKAQKDAGEDAGEYRSALKKIRTIRHRVLFAQKQARKLRARLGRQSSDTVLSNSLDGLDTAIENALKDVATSGVAGVFGFGSGPAPILAAAMPGVTIYAGATIAIGFSRNDYDGVLFDGAGPGAGGQIGFRYRFPSNWFVGAEVGGVGLGVAGNHREGPFADANWQLWQIAQVGYVGQVSGAPVAVYAGGGVTEARFTAGFDNGFFRDATSDVVTGWVVRGGAEFGVWQNASVGTVYQFSRFNGRVEHEPIKADIHMVLITFNYHVPVGR